MIISTHLVKASKLGQIISSNPTLFSPKESEDSDFNMLSIFILYERLKKQDSFYAPMFEVSEQNYSLLNWSSKELDLLEDEGIKEQVNEFQKDMEENWVQIREIINKNPNLFETELDLDKDIKKLYIWAYEFVMTRCYGWSLPSTILIPLADFLNHHKHGSDHYLIHQGYELNETKKHEGYNVKKQKVDLSELSSFKNSLTDAGKKRLYRFMDQKINYIEENFDYLNREERETFCLDLEEMKSGDLRKMVNKINCRRMMEDEKKQIYHFQFFETSDDEDNDTGI